MGTKVSDIGEFTDLALGDYIYGLRPSLGAAGSFKIKVENYEASINELQNKHILVFAPPMMELLPGNAIIGGCCVPVDVLMPAVGNLSCSKSLVAATNDTTLLLKKNGTNFGSVFYAAASTTGVVTVGADTTFAPGDLLTYVNAASPDPTLVSVFTSIWGRRI